MALTPQWLDELRARTTLSAVISRSVRLQKAGREFKACCPFHDEKTPSFYVNDEKGFYHCFGCSAHGDAIRWLMDQQGLPFIDAVKDLAAEAGLDVPAPDPRAARQAEQRASLHDVLAEAQAFFRNRLRAGDGAKARAYMQKRGISEAIAAEFGFGYAPDDRGAIRSALSGYTEDMLVEAGLLIHVDGKQPYDRFRGRLTLPIEDRRGRVVGFGGRLLEDREKAPKYLNSPDTPVFDKGRMLFNLHRAAPAARAKERLIVVEGYMDVVALAGAGIAEAVAPMGTALTEQQLALLWQQVPSPILCFDGDEAGRRAAMRAILRALPLLEPGHSLSIVSLPRGVDPDDLVRAEGVAGFEAEMAKASSLIDFLWNFELNRLPLDTPEDIAGLRARLFGHVDEIADEQIRALYGREISQRYSALAFPKKDWSRQDFSKHGGKVVSIRDAQVFRARVASQKLEQERLQDRLGAAIAYGFLIDPSEIARHADKLALMDPALLDRRIDAMLDLDRPTPDAIVSALYNRDLEVPHPRQFDFLRFAFAWVGATERARRASMRKAVVLYADMPMLIEELALATARLADDFTEPALAEQQRLLARKQEIEERLKEALEDVA